MIGYLKERELKKCCDDILKKDSIHTHMYMCILIIHIYGQIVPMFYLMIFLKSKTNTN